MANRINADRLIVPVVFSAARMPRNKAAGVSRLPRRLVGAMTTAAILAALIGSTTSAAAGRTCVHANCSWTVVMGKCKTLGGIRVPCPLKKKVCAEYYCY